MLLILPGALTVLLAFNSGGYFAGATAVASLIVAAALIVRLILADAPLAGFTRLLAVAVGALMLYAAWVLLSADWSHSSSRALVEFNRTLLYVLALVLFASVPHSPQRLRHVVWSLAIGFTVVCAAGVLTRTLPDVFTISAPVQLERLSYPIGYWNALGLMAALGIVLCLHLASSEREPRVARVLGAAALPVLAATLLFTFSRGPIAAAVVGVLGYVVIARPRALVSGVLAGGPTVALALLAAYRADLLASKHPTTPAAAAQGHDVALILAICVALAAGLRAALLWLDPRLSRARLERGAKRRLLAGATALLVLAGLYVILGTPATTRLQAQANRFTRSEVRQTGDYRDRLTDPGINRLDHWKIDLKGFEAAPFRGQGAGTFALLWARQRPTEQTSEEGHSLYLEVMGELGVVGIALLDAVLIALLFGVLRRVGGPNRALYGAVFVAALVWALAAGIDWFWEVPAVTLWLFALVGQGAAAALAWRPAHAEPDPERPGPRRSVRVLLVAGSVGLAATPALVAVSQARLTQSVKAYRAGDCTRASAKARASVDALGNRPEPFEVIGYCEARAGRTGVAEEAMRAAIVRDPANWQYHYDLALVRAAGGRDPRSELRVAQILNPRELQVRDVQARVQTNDPRTWRASVRDKIGLPGAAGG